MEISPRELRDADIPEKFRGYDKDVVDEFLERAAATVEALQERNRQLTERLQVALAAAETAAAMPPAAVQPEPAPIPEPIPQPEPEPEPEPAPLPAVVAPAMVAPVQEFPDDLIQRTLLTAQRAADQTIAEADAYALRTREDANRTAAETIAGANSEADRVEAERRAALDRVLQELDARRRALEAGIDVLERFDVDFRARLRAAIESDLAAIERRPVLTPGARPEIESLTVDALDAGTPALEAASGAEDGTPALESADGPDTSEARTDLESGPGSDDELDGDLLPGAPEDMPAIDAEALDDEEFFASLREAVHDDAPLGERDARLFPRE